MICCKDCAHGKKSSIGAYSKLFCEHPVCFELGVVSCPILGDFKEKRTINSLEVLNTNNDCQYFKPSLWKRIKTGMGL